jgi:hypothetical protein
MTRSTGRITIFLQSFNESGVNVNLLEKVMQTSFTLPRNTSLFDKPIDYRTKIQPAKGVNVRSRIEYIIFDALDGAGLQFEYEKPLKLSNKNYVIRPDFTIMNANGDTYYWEHLGKLDTGNYYNYWHERKEDYIRNGLYDNLITTDEIGGIVKEKIMEVIKDVQSQSVQDTPSSNFSKHHYKLY